MPQKIKIHAVANAPKSACAGMFGDAFKIKIGAQAVDGRANAELVKFLAKKFGVSKNGVRICAGETSRGKLVEIDTGADAKKILLGGE